MLADKALVHEQYFDTKIEASIVDATMKDLRASGAFSTEMEYVQVELGLRYSQIFDSGIVQTAFANILFERGFKSKSAIFDAIVGLGTQTTSPKLKEEIFAEVRAWKGDLRSNPRAVDLAIHFAMNEHLTDFANKTKLALPRKKWGIVGKRTPLLVGEKPLTTQSVSDELQKIHGLEQDTARLQGYLTLVGRLGSMPRSQVFSELLNVLNNSFVENEITNEQDITLTEEVRKFCLDIDATAEEIRVVRERLNKEKLFIAGDRNHRISMDAVLGGIWSLKPEIQSQLANHSPKLSLELPREGLPGKIAHVLKSGFLDGQIQSDHYVQFGETARILCLDLKATVAEVAQVRDEIRAVRDYGVAEMTNQGFPERDLRFFEAGLDSVLAGNWGVEFKPEPEAPRPPKLAKQRRHR